MTPRGRSGSNRVTRTATTRLRCRRCTVFIEVGEHYFLDRTAAPTHTICSKAQVRPWIDAPRVQQFTSPIPAPAPERRPCFGCDDVVQPGESDVLAPPSPGEPFVRWHRTCHRAWGRR